jgi:hypothetical protein
MTKNRQNPRGNGLGDSQSRAEWTSVMVGFVMMIEAAGNFDRACDLGMLEGLDPLILRGLRRVVPASRGGGSTDSGAEIRWNELVEMALRDDDARTLFVQMRADLRSRPTEHPPADLLSRTAALEGMVEELLGLIG